MQENPLLIILMFAGTVYVGHLWWQDYRARLAGQPNPKALPGATPCAARWVWVGALGALALVGLETVGEYALGISSQQTTIPVLFLLSMLAAGFLEELVFRGFLVVTTRGKAALLASVVGFSALFALAHVQYYLKWDEGAAWYQFELALTLKAAWTLGLLFVRSLFFYALRFLPQNPTQSLLPCFAAHTLGNLAVFLIKLAQGHVVGWY